MKLEIYPELCCDYCNEVIHNHFDCPVCKKNYAGTSIYGDFYYEFDGKNYMSVDNFSCQECGTKFKLLEKGCGLDEWEWEVA